MHDVPVEEDPAGATPVDLVVEGDAVVTVDPDFRIVRTGAVAVAGDRIAAITTAGEARQRWPEARRLGGPGHIVMPGLINAHQHLTGDRLLRSTIPDTIPSAEAIAAWAVPSHLAHSPDDDELSATLALVDAARHGITFTVEAGTVAHPGRVLAAYDRVGVAGRLGTWGSDTAGLPFAGSVGDVMHRAEDVLALTNGHALVAGWVTLVGHDLMSIDLATAASQLARDRHTGLTFHLSPTVADTTGWVARTGRRPVLALADHDVLGDHVLVAHAVHIDDHELAALVDTGTAVVTCPWAYLRLGQGVAAAGRHDDFVRRGGRLAVGCDAENAGDRLDVLGAAALAVGLWRDRGHVDFDARWAIELATRRGAEAVGMGHEIGSLTPGRRADLIVIDASGPAWMPPADDPSMSLAWGPGAATTRHVVVAGRVVVDHGQPVGIDLDGLATEAVAARRALLDRLR